MRNFTWNIRECGIELYGNCNIKQENIHKNKSKWNYIVAFKREINIFDDLSAVIALLLSLFLLERARYPVSSN